MLRRRVRVAMYEVSLPNAGAVGGGDPRIASEIEIRWRAHFSKPTAFRVLRASSSSVLSTSPART